MRNPVKTIQFINKNVGQSESGMANVVAKLSVTDLTWLTADAAEELHASLENTAKLLAHAREKLSGIMVRRAGTEIAAG